jgi:hypothetical protein
MASIQGKRGSYRVMWREGGKLRASTTYDNRADAEDFLRGVEDRIGAERRGRGPVLGSTPLKELLERHARSRLAARRARGPAMAEKSDQILAAAKEMKWETIRDITTDSVDKWRSKRPEGRGTDKPLVQIKSFLRWCRKTLKLPVDLDVLDLEARRTSGRQPPPRLTDDQVAAILGLAFKAKPCVGAAIEHLLLYGCRPIDVCRARVRDWDVAARVITYRDTKNTDDISHPVHAAHAGRLDALAAGRKPDDPLFLDPWGRQWRMTTVDKETGAVVDMPRAEGICSWYKANIGEKLGPCERRWAKGVPPKDPNAVRGGTILARNQRGIYMLKDYAMSRLAIASNGDRRAVATISGHRTLSVIDRYLSANRQTQDRLLTGIELPLIDSGLTSVQALQSTHVVQALPRADESPSSSVPNPHGQG